VKKKLRILKIPYCW